MLIGQAAEEAGVPARAIRYYERRGLLPEPRRAANGYRVYDDSTVARLRFIRSAQAAGLTLAEINRVIDFRDAGTAPCGHVNRLIADKIEGIRHRRRQLEQLEQELEELAERGRRLDPDDCRPDQVCHILEGARVHRG